MKIISLFFVLLLIGCEKSTESTIELPARSFENRVGTVFTSLPEDLFKAPTIEEIILPQQDSVDAIWGAIGRDDEGYIYFSSFDEGVESEGINPL